MHRLELWVWSCSIRLEYWIICELSISVICYAPVNDSCAVFSRGLARSYGLGLRAYKIVDAARPHTASIKLCHS